MAITINGNGTVTGISAGGLPSAATDLTNDTSPQLGGTLDCNGQAVQFKSGGGNVKVQYAVGNDAFEFADNAQIRMGASDDLKIYHDSGGNSFIEESGSGSLVVKADDLYIQNVGGTHTNLFADSDGGVELYHNGTKRFETTSAGGSFDSAGDTILGLHTSNGTAHCRINFSNNSGNGYGGVWYSSGNNLEFRANNAERMRISSNGDIGAPTGDNIYDASDERLKENMLELTDGLNKINKLKPISYNYKVGWNKDTEGKTKYGFGAQTTEKVDKLLVESFSDNDATLNGETIKNPLRVNEKFIIPLLVKAIQELTAKVEALEAA